MSTGDAGSLGAAFDRTSRDVRRVLDAALAGREVSVADATALAHATGRDLAAMTVAADETSRPFEHDGETYYFCCPGCRAAFEKDPSAYTTVRG